MSEKEDMMDVYRGVEEQVQRVAETMRCVH